MTSTALPGRRLQAVLFDLDGTLIDSVGDLGRAANAMRQARGLAELPLGDYRPHGGSGARGMLSVAFGVSPVTPTYAELRSEFLDHYQRLMFDTTAIFAEVPRVLAALSAAGLRWGIVTNKAEHLARPLVSALDLEASVLIGGDTTAQAKPHPEPLLEAARRLDVVPGACLYVGDDLRDMQAGRAAGMATAVAAWGYLGPAAKPEQWPADAQLKAPTSLLKLLGLD